MELVNKESWQNFVKNSDFSEILGKWKTLFIENRTLYLVMNNTDEEKEVLRKSFGVIKIALLQIGIDRIKPIEKSEEEVLFMKKVIEMAKAKTMTVRL